MGYCMHQRDSKFLIKSENKQKTLNAIKSLAGKETIEDSGGRHFSWVDQDFAEADSLDDIMRCWRWNVNENKEADVVGIHFGGEKYGDDKILFKVIAPFVENGSYIEMQGEEGEVWRWVFNNGDFKEVYGKLIFEDE